MYVWALVRIKNQFSQKRGFLFWKSQGYGQQYRNIFGCESGSLPFRYLGVPIHHRKLKNSEWHPVESRLMSKLSCWQGKLLSYRDRLILINSIMTRLSMFMLSFIEIPVGVRKRLDFYRSRFFGKVMVQQRNIGYRDGTLYAVPRIKGLGIEVLELKNKCLLSKWLFKLLSEEGMWQELLYNKYFKNKTLAQVEAKPTNSPL